LVQILVRHRTDHNVTGNCIDLDTIECLDIMSDQKRLLIVDDDPGLREDIAQYLGDHGYLVHAAENGRAMDVVLGEHDIDLIVLDLMMPGEDGLSICRRLDRVGGPAVIMASAAGDETDRILGLELGADDYLPKPFSPRELLARIRAVLRRREDAGRGGPARGDTYRFAGFSYDPARRRLRSPDDATVLLTGGESSLLGALLANGREPLTREQMIGLEDGESVGRGVDLHISRLRKKLEAHGGGHIIRTHRGLGYMIDCPITRA
jgi:two-component system OmpR family response regulator